MRDAKDLTKKVGCQVRADPNSSALHPLFLSRVDPKRSTTLPVRVDYVGSADERNKRRRDNKKDDDNSFTDGAENNKNKRKRASE